MTYDVSKLFFSFFPRKIISTMPPLDLEMINQLGRDLHPVPNGLMGEEEVCPWTLFLTMALTLLKGEGKRIMLVSINCFTMPEALCPP